MRLVFAGTPEVAAKTLEHLLQQGQHEVVAVLTRPDAAQGRSSRKIPSPVAQLAERAGIEVLRPTRPRDPELAERLAQLAPECCPVVAYGGLIPQALLELPAHGWVNVHYSLLPRWRGAAPVQHSILAGDEIGGVSVFQLVSELDAGPIYAQQDYQFGETETAGEALTALEPIGARTLVEVLDELEGGTAVAAPQPTAGITLAPKLSQAAARLDWRQSALQLSRQIRANSPSPIAWTELAGERFRVLSAAPTAGSLASGEIQAEKKQVLVGTGEGLLRLGQVQPAGKRPLAAADWGRGLRGPGRFE